MSGASDPAMIAKECLEEVVIQRDEAIKRAIDLEAELNKVKAELLEIQAAYIELSYKDKGNG